ncbi:MAG: hypothetical protein A4E72_02298 [Syntrophus sp. PtaU1.Bin208]|nr:MAG: hypothetical protein A4E72_02298 [Syntrophus sp. PtaU1.Bin208]
MFKSFVKKTLFAILSISLFFLSSGCGVETAIVAGGAAVGAGTGTFFFVNGELKTDYPYSFDKVWTACERTVADMRGTAVDPKKEISEGTISTRINDETVKFTVKYKDKNLTTVGVRVGIMGDQNASKMLHNKISDNIPKG